VIGGQRLLELRADRGGALFVLVTGRRFIRRNARLSAVEEVIHRLRRKSRRPLADDTCHRGVQVAIRSKDAEGLHPALAELIVRERAHVGEGIPPATLGGIFHQHAEGEWRHRLGEHLAHVGAGPERKPVARVTSDDPWLHDAPSRLQKADYSE
jgi:hypothetical protein